MIKFHFFELHYYNQLCNELLAPVSPFSFQDVAIIELVAVVYAGMINRAFFSHEDYLMLPSLAMWRTCCVCGV